MGALVRVGGVILVLALWSARVAHADVSEQDAKQAGRRALVVLRVLAYDKALAARSKEPEVVVLLVAKGSAGRVERERWRAGFALLPSVRVGGRPVRVIDADYAEGTFDKLVAAQHPAVVIVMSDVADDPSGVIRVTRAHHALTFSPSERAVRAGLAVALVPAAERDEIFINLDAARAEGARFGAGLLQLVTLVDESEP